MPASAAVTAGVAGVWVVLTAWTGLTFHFYPGIVLLAPVFLMRLLSPLPIASRTLAGLLAAGTAAVAAGWLVLGALDARPTATFVHGQWGGVELEVVVFSVLGAVLATRMARRPDRPVRTGTSDMHEGLTTRERAQHG